ncbi:MAG: toxin-antitoxin system HicB family antitoxin [Acidimicrobiia bacterium]
MGRPKVYEEQRVTTAVRIPESTHEKLREEARERDVSVNYLIVRAVERYLHSPPTPE